MFSDIEMTILTLHSLGLVVNLISAVIFFIVALTLYKQRLPVAKYIITTSIIYFIVILAIPVYAGYAGASPGYDELNYRVYSEVIELAATFLLLVNCALAFVGIRALIKKSA